MQCRWDVAPQHCSCGTLGRLAFVIQVKGGRVDLSDFQRLQALDLLPTHRFAKSNFKSIMEYHDANFVPFFIALCNESSREHTRMIQVVFGQELFFYSCHAAPQSDARRRGVPAISVGEGPDERHGDEARGEGGREEFKEEGRLLTQGGGDRPTPTKGDGGGDASGGDRGGGGGGRISRTGIQGFPSSSQAASTDAHALPPSYALSLLFPSHGSTP